MSITRIIGIDFGTSTSVIRAKRYQEDGKPVDDRLYTTEVKFGNVGLVPTLIQKIQDGIPYYGYDAQKPRKKSALFQSFKIDLESSDLEARAQARALTEEFFAYMAKQYRDQGSGGFFGEADDTEKTLVSYPVKWSEETRKFMLEAARKAGFPNVEGMDEAQAAITAVMVRSESYLSEKGYLHDGTPVNILLADMGAGTTDLVLCRYTPGRNAGYEVLSTWPRDGGAFFGGREIEGLLQEYLRGKLPEEDADAVMKRCGLDKFKSWKEDYVSPALERNEAVTEFFEFDDRVEDLEIDMEDYSLDRAELERLALNYLRGFPRLVNGCLKDAGLSGSEMDLVLLTGGHSQWYFVAEQLKGRMSQCGEIDLAKIKADHGRIIPVPRPQETVALGLVYSPLMEQIRFAKKSEPEPVHKVSQQPAPKTTPQSIPKPTSQPDRDSGVWNESMRRISLTPEEEFEFRAVGGDYKVEMQGNNTETYKIEYGFEVVKYLGNRKVVSIPSQYKGKPVVAIGKSAFDKAEGNALELNVVEIPGSCRVIGMAAFRRAKRSGDNYTSLKEVILHQGLQAIGEFAFQWNGNLSLVLPDGLIDIGSMAFFACDFKIVCVPASCQSIRSRAFSCNHHLSQVLFEPDAQIEKINEMAFDATDVYRIKLPRNCRCYRLVREEGKKLVDRYGVGDFGLFNIPKPDKLITIERY